MSVTDGLFNFPAVNFIYVHNITVLRTSDISYTADRDGKTIAQDVVRDQVKAYVTSPTVALLGDFADQVDAVILIPYTIDDIHPKDILEVPAQTNIIPYLTGTYAISTGGIHPTPLHMRLFVKRPLTGDPNRNNPVN